MPGLDLCAPRLCRTRCALLSEERNQAAAPQGGIYLRRLAVRRCEQPEQFIGNSLVDRVAQRRGEELIAVHDVATRHCRWLATCLQCTEVKNRARRKPDSQVQTGWPRMPRSHEPTTASARPTRSSIGSRPTPPSRTATRLSEELSRLSPITNRRPCGTVTSGVLSSRPLSCSLKIAWLTPPGNVSI